ncbi:CrcB family protein [Microbacterium betulae]|uniref:Fluoride-specific ion channel FluC n=1 Tax=Microbacterium betulae TaxID=2981139 RepID=A0AA97FKZ4_9MICO|nr:CrcB family protein [Microbacterium sp. AB]WOF24769.1 CrcB family protein [Microbacterium sp. AB]
MRRIRWELLTFVCLGGALGTGARYALTLPVRGDDAAGFWATAAVNVAGSLLLGVVVGALGDRHPRWRALLGPGVLGGFTTYSAFAVQVGSLATPSGHGPIAPFGTEPLGYVLMLSAALLVLFLATASAVAGLVVGGRLARGATGGDA